MFHPSQFVPDIEIGDQVKLGENPIKRLIQSETLFKPGVKHVCSPQTCALRRRQQQQPPSSGQELGGKDQGNPLLLPLKYGFHRVALKQDPRRRRPDDQEEAFAELQYSDQGVKLAYVLYCMEHVRRYLAAVQQPRAGPGSEGDRQGDLELDLDHFTFAEGFHLKRQTVGNAHTYCPDVSCGREERPVSAINQVDERSFQFDFQYVAARRFFNQSPGGVHLEDFRVSCSCPEGGDCGEAEACACRMLTRTDNCGMSGYSYKRLMTKHDFGVFECNAGCRCGPRCLNRVVGNGVRAQLQAFATRRKGWGVRALHFIPRGSFVCVYHGQILTDDQANLVAKDYYLAALDHIEVAVESAGDSARRGGGSRVDPEEVKQNLSRSAMFGQARPHVVDGSRYTNVGRFFNHSCAPNMFIQNVFLETHDLRFSHLAYFTSVDVAPMEELTWDYNWQINRELDRQPVYCNCLDLRCAFRLR
ncbi:Histone-lysine N-methyltransferase [Tyrophagus putrescentiae]|nr:Histone-lysine N-methyltransferase [Tyrophagus putrescentiae]